jgi:hypothetical protein
MQFPMATVKKNALYIKKKCGRFGEKSGKTKLKLFGEN